MTGVHRGRRNAAALTSGEFELLLLLASQSGEFVHRDTIARTLGSKGEGRRSADMQRRGSGTDLSGLALETAPNRPLPRGHRSASVAEASPGLHQARDSVGHWRASAAVPKNQFLVSGYLPAGRTATSAVAPNEAAPARKGAARNSPAPAAPRRQRRAAVTTTRHRGRAGRRDGEPAVRWMGWAGAASSNVLVGAPCNILLQARSTCCSVATFVPSPARDASHGRNGGGLRRDGSGRRRARRRDRVRRYRKRSLRRRQRTTGHAAAR